MKVGVRSLHLFVFCLLDNLKLLFVSLLVGKRPKNVMNGGEAGPSVGNRSVGGDHLQHFLGSHLQLGALGGHWRRSQGCLNEFAKLANQS